MSPEEYPVILERYGQQLISIQSQLNDLREVQREIKKMNEVLINLTSEIKFTNSSLIGHEKRLTTLEKRPAARYEQIVGAVVSALICGIIGYLLAKFLI